MKITISKQILENILIHAGPFLEKKDTSQITSHIYISIQNSQLLIKATDYEIGFSVQTDSIEIIEEGSTTANGRKFLDIVKILKDGAIELETKNNFLHITQKSSNFKLPTFAYNEFPMFPTIEDKAKISIDSFVLRETLKKITPSIDTNNPKMELNGALMDIQKEGINFASTDTKRLAIVNIENINETLLSIIIPKKALIEIQKLFLDEIELYYDNSYLIIQSNQFLFFTKLINGTYPNYARIIPQEIAHTFVLPKKSIIESIKQMTTISEEIEITFFGDTITFQSLSDDNIEAKTEITYSTHLQTPFSIAVNSKFILDFLNVIQSSEFTIGLNESNLPFTLTDGNFKTIIMPIIL